MSKDVGTGPSICHVLCFFLFSPGASSVLPTSQYLIFFFSFKF